MAKGYLASLETSFKALPEICSLKNDGQDAFHVRAANFIGKSGDTVYHYRRSPIYRSPKKAKAVSIARNGLHKFGSVLLSQGQILSTIAAERLNFRVRNGNGWNPLAIATEKWVLMVAG